MSLAPAAEDLVGRRYRLGRLLGRGAVGAVYAAEDIRTRSLVALKLMPASVGVDAASSGREQRAAGRLDHPGIAALLDAGRDDRHLWLASELVAGANLLRYTTAPRLLPEALVARTCAQVARALAHAHSHGVVHRDLKPANVMLDIASGAVKVLDFGVARIDDGFVTRTGLTLGTPSYMAPEQLAGAPASPSSDTYALGVLTFELLSGRRPHEAQTLGELLRAVATAEPARLAALRPELPVELVQLVEDLLQREAARRLSELTKVALRFDAIAERLDSDRRRQS